MELGPHRIRVNAICPGSVRGPRIDGVIERDAEKRGLSAAEIRRVYKRQTSLRSSSTPRTSRTPRSSWRLPRVQ